MGTGIEWTDETWNPIVGCSAVSPGCDHCYAERESAGRLRNVPVYQGLTEDGKWTGQVRFIPERLDQPLRWKRPRRIFVNSMSDLFHPEVLKMEHHNGFPPLAWIVAVMVATERHTFQVLTKRPQVMAAVLREPMFKLDVNACLLQMGHTVMRGGMSETDTPWPAHIWWGTSIESQSYAFRARYLLETPAAVRFVSAEPLLGPLWLRPYLDGCRPGSHSELTGQQLNDGGAEASEVWVRVADRGLDWVICGGESGPGARPMHPDWARSLRDQCQEAGVAFLFKQWGEWAPRRDRDYVDLSIALDGRTWRGPDVTAAIGARGMHRYGKHAAGRELDGRTWDEYPA